MRHGGTSVLMADDLNSLRLGAQLCFALYSATHAVTRVYRPLLAELGLTYPQYLVLLVLLEREESTVNGIAEALRLDAATVTPLLKRLADAGFVTRERSRTDERVVRVRPTPKGHGLGGAFLDIHHEVRCRLGMDERAFAQLRGALEALSERLGREEAVETA